MESLDREGHERMRNTRKVFARFVVQTAATMNESDSFEGAELLQAGHEELVMRNTEAYELEKRIAENVVQLLSKA